MKKRKGGMMSGCMWMKGGTRGERRRGRAEARVKGQLVNPHCSWWAHKGRREGSECMAEWTTGEHAQIGGISLATRRKERFSHSQLILLRPFEPVETFRFLSRSLKREIWIHSHPDKSLLFKGRSTSSRMCVGSFEYANATGDFLCCPYVTTQRKW